MLKSLLHAVFKGRWKVVQTGWPYRPGYGSYCPRRRIVLDTGLTKEEAQHIVDELNRTFQ